MKTDNNFVKMQWNKIWDEELDNPKVHDISVFLKKVLKVIKSRQKILSLGPGNALDEMYLAKQKHIVEAIDISDVAVDRINSDAIKKGLNHYIHGKAQSFLDKFQYPDYYFDVVYSNSSLHYFDDAEMTHILSEAHRVLNTNGMFFMVARASTDWKNNDDYAKNIGTDVRLDKRGLKMRFFNKESIEKLLKGKFKPIKIEEIIIERYSRENYKEPPSTTMEVFAQKI